MAESGVTEAPPLVQVAYNYDAMRWRAAAIHDGVVLLDVWNAVSRVSALSHLADSLRRRAATEDSVVWNKAAEIAAGMIGAA